MNTNTYTKEVECPLSKDGRRYPAYRDVTKARRALGGAESSRELTDWYVAQFDRVNHLTSEQKK